MLDGFSLRGERRRAGVSLAAHEETRQMPQYMLPRSVWPQIPEMLSDSGTIAVQPIGDQPVKSDAAQWRRFTCRAGNATAITCVGEHQELPEWVVISISADLRRLLMVWRLPADLRLVRRLTQAIQREGALLLDN